MRPRNDHGDRPRPHTREAVVAQAVAQEDRIVAVRPGRIDELLERAAADVAVVVEPLRLQSNVDGVARTGGTPVQFAGDDFAGYDFQAQGG